jgi:hypothetical protein
MLERKDQASEARQAASASEARQAASATEAE